MRASHHVIQERRGGEKGEVGALLRELKRGGGGGGGGWENGE